jgi:CTP synthase
MTEWPLKLKILIVDDKPDSVESVQAEVRGKMADATSEVVRFEAAEEMIESYVPDIIVLDLAEGVLGNEGTPGLQTRDYIWDKRFCPLVFYTAFTDLLKDDQRLKHPLIKVVKKGSGSEHEVMGHILDFVSPVSAINQAGKEIRWALNSALREVASRVFDSTKDVNQIPETLTRSARRRVAARMDEELSTGGPNLKTWEHYLCPPTTTGHLLTGDVIRKRTGDEKEPTSYAIILTPSCDLACDEKRKPKVTRTLVALCKDVQRLLQDISPADRKNQEECKKRLRLILTQGHGHSCLPVPALPGKFPPMAADFRDLKLIELADIGDDREYVRVASVDNPFRELVAWAYVLNAARPGLPDRDFDSWVEEIFDALPEFEKKA